MGETLSVPCSPRCLSIRLTETLHKWLLPWRNYILSRPVAATGLNQNTRDAASESCTLEIPAFLWSGFSSAKKRSGSSSENKLTTYRDFPAFLHLAHFPLFWMKHSLLRNNHTWRDVVSRHSVVEMLWGFRNLRNLKLTWGVGRQEQGRSWLLKHWKCSFKIKI